MHTALVELPDLLRDLGTRTIVLDGWLQAQGSYWWRDSVSGFQGADVAPSCYMIHHSAGTSARPVVRDAAGRWSVANAWIGLDRGDGVLRASGDGEATVVLTAAGPARYSAGQGYWPALQAAIADDRDPPLRAEGPDGAIAANRYAYSVEVVHPGDGGDIGPGVELAIADLGTALAELGRWESPRLIGHRGWTRRKIDPRWTSRLDPDTDPEIVLRDLIVEQQGGGMRWFQIIVEGWAEDVELFRREVTRWRDEGLFGGSVEYWVGLLETPDHPDWPGFIARTVFLTAIGGGVTFDGPLTEIPRPRPPEPPVQ